MILKFFHYFLIYSHIFVLIYVNFLHFCFFFYIFSKTKQLQKDVITEPIQESININNDTNLQTHPETILSNTNTLNLNNNNHNNNNNIVNKNNNNNFTSLQNLELSTFTNNSDLMRDPFLTQLVEANIQGPNSIIGITKESSSIHNPSESDMKIKFNDKIKSRILKPSNVKYNKYNNLTNTLSYLTVYIEIEIII
jgi:hypothetical protein